MTDQVRATTAAVETPAAPPGTLPPGRTAGWLLLVLLSGQAMANIDTAVANVAAPSMQSDLSASDGGLTLVVAGYVLLFALALVPGARLAGRLGVRRAFLGGLALFTAASLLCGLAPGTGVLIAARLVQGVGAGLMVPSILIGIQQWFPAERRAQAIGLYAATLSGSAALGQILGGVLVSADVFGTGWRAAFLINVPAGIAALAVGARLLPRPAARGTDARAAGEGLDLAGTALLAAVTLAAVLPPAFGPGLGWPWWMWAVLALTVPGLIAFARTERRVARAGGRPALDLRPLSVPAVRWALLAQAGFTLTYLAVLYVLALHLQQQLGLSPWQSGLVPLGWVLCFGITGPLLPRLPAPLRRLLPVLGGLLLVLSYAALAALQVSGGARPLALAAVLCAGGLGLGSTFSSLLTLLTVAVPPRFAADLSGSVNTIAQLAGVLGVAVFGTLYPYLAGRGGAADAPGTAFTLVALGLAGVAALSTGAALFAVRRRAG
ncbi:MFS transporter [Kitasatospora sp. NPDC057223]|uniref:MFS transporter n=1 Tax=Kitasatospora sp. NPDC057223 TaxID=3346055 RepID=UPI003636171D